MDTEPLYIPKKNTDLSGPTRVMILQDLVPLASSLASSQVEAFTTRLAQNLYKHANQAMRAEDARISLEAHQLLQRNSANFYRLVAGHIHASLSKEVSVFNTRKKIKKDEHGLIDPNQTFTQVESEVLIRHLSQSLEMQNAPALIKLNTLIGRVLNRTPIDITQNPFRPELFVLAVFHSWSELDPNHASHLLLLRALNVNDFLHLTPIYDEIIEGLLARGFSLNSPESQAETMLKLDAFAAFKQIEFDPYLNEKLKHVLGSDVALANLGSIFQLENDSEFQMNVSDMEEQTESRTEEHLALDCATMDRQFFYSLSQLQKDLQQEIQKDESNSQLGSEHRSSKAVSNLRKLLSKTSAQNLNVTERNIIELMARVFDFIFADKNLSDEIKQLIAQLQVPLLRTSLSDKDFFFKAQHPARTLLDMLGRTCINFDHQTQPDPLLNMMHDVVERVQLEFEEEIDLFSDVVADLENFLNEEEQRAQKPLRNLCKRP